MMPFFNIRRLAGATMYGVFNLKRRVIIRFNGDDQGVKFWYQVYTRWVLLLGPLE